jgi:hypothetical protein
MKFIWFFLLFSTSYASTKSYDDSEAKFSARISRLNKEAKLMRLKVSFENAKFLRKRDRIEFWNETYPDRKCLSYIEGRTPEYILVKIPRYNDCISKMYITTGTYLHLYSPDLKKGIEIAKSLMEILMKKQLALKSRMRRFKDRVDGHVDRVELINKRYDILRQKLDIEWQSELASLEEDKVKNYKSYQTSKVKYEDLMYKLEQYRINDNNLKEDRWSLDPNLYYQK